MPHADADTSVNPFPEDLIWPNATANLRAAVEDMFQVRVGARAPRVRPRARNSPLQAAGVDFYVTGHVHAYERTYPVYQSQVVSVSPRARRSPLRIPASVRGGAQSYVNAKAVVQVLVGGAGCIEGLTKSWISPAPAWLAGRVDGSTGYGQIDFVNATEARFRYFNSSSSLVIDEFVLTKAR